MRNKLVRDKIPELVFNSGHHTPPRFKTSSGTDLQASLINKLDEELREVSVAFFSEKTDDGDVPDGVIEELADVLEVAYSIAKLRGVSNDELDKVRQTKLEKHGGFEHGYIMDMNH